MPALHTEHFENGCLQVFPSPLCDFFAEMYVSYIQTIINLYEDWEQNFFQSFTEVCKYTKLHMFRECIIDKGV